MSKAITIWRFEDAPKMLQDLSTNGGDEDWLAIVPKSIMTYGLPTWMESSAFAIDGCLQQVEHREFPNDVIVISSHA